jgi:thiol-disulfide isomerase/thioredoxin
LLTALIGLVAIGCGAAQLGGNESKVPDFEIAPYGEFDVFGPEPVAFHDVLSRGQPVVLNMWAGLCPPCRAEMPDLQAVHDEYKDRVVLIGLDVGPFTGLGTRDDGQALVNELNITYPTGSTFDAEIVREYGVLGMPSTYFIKPNGEILRKWTGLIGEDDLREITEVLISKS